MLLCVHRRSIFSNKYQLITQVLPDCKLLRNKVICHFHFMHSWCASFPEILQTSNFAVSVLSILKLRRIERRKILQEASFLWEGTDHRVLLVSGQWIWACTLLITPTLYDGGPFSVYVLDLKLHVTKNIIRVYKRNLNLLNHRNINYVFLNTLLFNIKKFRIK